MKTILLHIGRHKSGTTALQHSFFINRDVLKRSGIYLPLTGIKKGHKAHHLISELLEKKARTQVIDLSKHELFIQLVAEINRCNEQYVLLTSEGFQNCAPKAIKALFIEFNVHVIFYMREQQSYLKSAYQQKIHATNYTGKVECFEKQFPVDYLTFYLSWVNVFSPDKVHVRVFERKCLEGQDIVTDFYKRIIHGVFNISVNYQSIPFDPFSSNVSLKGKYLGFKLRLNNVLETNDKLQGLLYRVLGLLSANLTEEDNFISDELAQLIHEKYSSSNKALLEKLEINSEALNFKKQATYNEMRLQGPKDFYNVLKKIINLEPACDNLLTELYQIRATANDGLYLLEISKNIRMDSLNHLQIKRISGELEPAAKYITSNNNDYYIKPSDIDFETDSFYMALADDDLLVSLIHN
jgi:hypothetical protein